MTKELAALTADIATETLQFMADREGISIGETLALVASGHEGARRQFFQLIELAQKTIREDLAA